MTKTENTKSLEFIAEKIGERFIGRIQNNFYNIIYKQQNSKIVDEIKNVKILFSAEKTYLKSYFDTELKIDSALAFDTISDGFKTKLLYQLLEKNFKSYYNSRQDLLHDPDDKNIKFLKIFYGSVIIWNSKADYYLSSIEESLNSVKLLKMLAYTGETHESRLLYLNTSACLISFFITNDQIYLYEMLGRLLDGINKNLNENPELHYIDNIFEFYLNFLQNFHLSYHYSVLKILEEIQFNFKVFERVFNNSDLSSKKFSEFGYLRERYKNSGNTIMVDKINKIRFQLLSESKELTPLYLERVFLKAWGTLTDWGASPQRLILLGAALYLALILCSYGSATEISNFKITNSSLESTQTIFSKAFEKFGSYAFQKNNSMFESKILDSFFSFVFHFYYLVILGALITYISRHNG